MVNIFKVMTVRCTVVVTTNHSNDQQDDDQYTIEGSQGEALMIALHCSLRHIGSPKEKVSSANWVT